MRDIISEEMEMEQRQSEDTYYEPHSLYCRSNHWNETIDWFFDGFHIDISFAKYFVFLLLIKPMSVQGVKNTYNHIPQNIYIPSWSAQLFLHSCLHVGIW